MQIFIYDVTFSDLRETIHIREQSDERKTLDPRMKNQATVFYEDNTSFASNCSYKSRR